MQLYLGCEVACFGGISNAAYICVGVYMIKVFVINTIGVELEFFL